MQIQTKMLSERQQMAMLMQIEQQTAQQPQGTAPPQAKKLSPSKPVLSKQQLAKPLPVWQPNDYSTWSPQKQAYVVPVFFFTPFSQFSQFSPCRPRFPQIPPRGPRVYPLPPPISSAWNNLRDDPSPFYYWYSPPGHPEIPQTTPFSPTELQKLQSIFTTRLGEHDTLNASVFAYLSMNIPGRPGVQLQHEFQRLYPQRRVPGTLPPIMNKFSPGSKVSGKDGKKHLEKVQKDTKDAQKMTKDDKKDQIGDSIMDSNIDMSLLPSIPIQTVKELVMGTEKAAKMSQQTLNLKSQLSNALAASTTSATNSTKRLVLGSKARPKITISDAGRVEVNDDKKQEKIETTRSITPPTTPTSTKTLSPKKIAATVAHTPPAPVDVSIVAPSTPAAVNDPSQLVKLAPISEVIPVAPSDTDQHVFNQNKKRKFHTDLLELENNYQFKAYNGDLLSNKSFEVNSTASVKDVIQNEQIGRNTTNVLAPVNLITTVSPPEPLPMLIQPRQFQQEFIKYTQTDDKSQSLSQQLSQSVNSTIGSHNLIEISQPYKRQRLSADLSSIPSSQLSQLPQSNSQNVQIGHNIGQNMSVSLMKLPSTIIPQSQFDESFSDKGINGGYPQPQPQQYTLPPHLLQQTSQQPPQLYYHNISRSYLQPLPKSQQPQRSIKAVNELQARISHFSHSHIFAQSVLTHQLLSQQQQQYQFQRQRQ